MRQQKIYDVIGIGIGPFNLGLAAILEDLPQLSAIFIDQKPTFDWHPGLLLPTARMQVPYFADLVTIVNPRSRFTYHNFLYETKHFFRFVNQNNNYPLRKEYNKYCQWVAAQLRNLLFGYACESITFDEKTKLYAVEVKDQLFHGKHLVLGTGTVPYLPQCLNHLNDQRVLHAKEYLSHKSKLLASRNITIIGSGQSAAEIFNDLLPCADEFEHLCWFTRSNRFHPMDVSPFTTEMTSVDYMDHFFEQDEPTKESVLQEQQYLYKGINAALLAQINEALYIRWVNGAKNNIHIQANCELIDAMHNQYDGILLNFKHRETRAFFQHATDAVITATGFQYQPPACIQPIKRYINWTTNNQYAVNRNYSIDSNNSIFVQNADLHTHGFNSADLGLGPYRNAVIINSIARKQYFTSETKTAFQQFKVVQ